jgi:hypothetical protein
MDIDDKIRQGKMRGQRHFLWNEVEWNELLLFIEQNGMTLIDGNGFMGATHEKVITP